MIPTNQLEAAVFDVIVTSQPGYITCHFKIDLFIRSIEVYIGYNLNIAIYFLFYPRFDYF